MTWTRESLVALFEEEMAKEPEAGCSCDDCMLHQGAGLLIDAILAREAKASPVTHIKWMSPEELEAEVVRLTAERDDASRRFILANEKFTRGQPSNKWMDAVRELYNSMPIVLTMLERVECPTNHMKLVNAYSQTSWKLWGFNFCPDCGQSLKGASHD